MEINLDRFSEKCICGKPHEMFVKKVHIGEGVSTMLSDVLKAEGCRMPVVVCDRNTAKYNGFGLATVTLPADSHADEKAVAVLDGGLHSGCDMLVALGAGTIHDVTRYVAHKRGVPFISMPTAASVDGFVSTVAAMTWNGLKQTFPAVSPVYVLADSNILCDAPFRLTASGVSDLFGKYTAIADWRIANIVTGEYICERICEMEMEAVTIVKDSLAGLKKSDKQAVEQLMYALLLSGLAMQMVGNSRPASGSEHHLSHLWEMEIINGHVDALHGEKVSVGLMLCLERYAQLKNFAVQSYDQDELKSVRGFVKNAELFKMLEELFESEGKLLLESVDAKRMTEKASDIRAVIESLPDPAVMRELLEFCGCKATLTDIGLPEEIKEASLILSPYVRNRLTLMWLGKMMTPVA